MHTYCFGVTDTVSGDPLTPDTKFQACSVSKTVAALAALTLVDDGLIGLDDDVNDLLTRWRVPPNKGWRPRITLRMLASHTAGLTTHGFAGYPAGSRIPTLIEILSGVNPANSAGVRVDWMPGLQFRYSGGGTTVIQLLFEELTGQPAETVLRTRVLEPLGMATSTFIQPLPAEQRAGAASGHDTNSRPLSGGSNTHPELCAAGMWSTPADLLRIVRSVRPASHMQERPGLPLLSGYLRKEMLRPHARLSTDLGRDWFDATGLGFFLGTEGGAAKWIGHSGSNEGYRCGLIASADGESAAAVMTNGEGGTRVVHQVLQAIAREYPFHGVQFDLSTPAPRTIPAEIVGTFLTPSGLPVRVERDGTDARLTVGDQHPVSVLPSSSHEWVAGEVDLMLRPGSGPAELILEQGSRRIECRRA